VRRVDLDERWHIGFGLRCLIEAKPSPELIGDLLAEAADAAAAWGDVVPVPAREYALRMCSRRLGIAGLMRSQAAA
jgi:ribonucleoside-diphosphate reductase beta chain